MADISERSVSASDVARHFAEVRDRVTAEGLVEVSAHGRLVMAMVSPAVLEDYRALKRREREVFTIEDMPEEVYDAVLNAEYGVASE